MYAPEAKGIRRAAILATMMMLLSAGGPKNTVQIKPYSMRYVQHIYALSQYASGIHSATTCRRSFYSADITRMVGFLCWAFCQSTFGSGVSIDDTQER